VSCGDNFTLVLNEKGQVYSFGKGSHGRLGQGSNSSQTANLLNNLDDSVATAAGGISDEPTLIEGPLEKLVVTDIAAGCRHASCLSSDGTLFTWGFNFYDQLGIGYSERDCYEPTLCLP